MQSVSTEVWQQKYQLKTKEGAAVDEDIHATFERVAVALAENEIEKQYWADQFLWALNNGAIPAGRILANAGAGEYKSATSTINCTVSGTIEDSMDSILTRLKGAGLTLKSGAGIGYEFSTLRPRGAYVSGAGAQTSGPLSFMDIYDKMCFTISSAGGRRGAQMATFDISHPDILDFVQAKREAGRLRQFNLSVLVSDAFMQALAGNKDWPLVFNGKEYRRESPQKIWDVIMRSTYEYAEPGIIFIDTVNNMNNLWWCENIRATNPCLTSDSWIHTDMGPRQVKDLIGQRFNAVINDEVFTSTDDGFFFTSIKETVKLTTKEGFSLTLTPDHKLYKINKKSGAWVPVSELKPGDSLAINNHRQLNHWVGKYNHYQGYLLGLLVGDGTFSENDAVLSVWESFYFPNGESNISAMLRKVEGIVATYNHRADFRGWRKVANHNFYTLKMLAITKLANELGLFRGNKTITREIEMTSSDFYTGFLQGLFDTDGTVIGDQNKGVSVRLSQSDLNLLEAVQRMLLRLGIVSTIYKNRRAEGYHQLPNGKGGYSDYFTKANHELVISNDNLFFYQQEIGFTELRKRNRLEMALAGYKRKLNKTNFIVTVDQIESADSQPVYDAQIPIANAFDANGFYAHNCGELPLPPHGSCLLGSINLTEFVENPFRDDAVFDYEKYNQVISIFTRMLDNVVEINGLPLPEQRNELVRKRRHGMGYLGLGSVMTMLKMQYGSKESLKFTKTVTECLALEGWRTGIELAKEKGSAPILEEYFDIAGQKISGKELLCNSKYLKQVCPEFLIDSIKTYGCRFTHHSAIAPTGTISLALANNASNGIEPSFAHSYSRNIIKEGKKTKEQVEVYSYEYLLFREMFGEKAPLPDYFVTANDVDPKSHIDVQAAAQYWIDSSISKTINVPSDYPYEQFKDLYRYTYKSGLKGCTTFRYNPEQFSGVLVKKDDLEKTIYAFELENGAVIEVNGNEEVHYDGETHTAANLYDALKEGYYGKF